MLDTLSKPKPKPSQLDIALQRAQEEAEEANKPDPEDPVARFSSAF